LTDLLLIIFTLALLFISQLIRMLQAMRIPSDLKFKPVKLTKPPQVMTDLFTQTHSELKALGFARVGWASPQTPTPLPGFVPPLVRLYHHRTQPVVARVSPPFNLFAGDHCQVVFISRSRERVYLATTNRMPELFPRPPETASIMVNTRVDSLAEQYRAHTDEMAGRHLTWQDRRAKLGALTWTLHLVNRLEQKNIKWIRESGFVRPLADGTTAPRLGIALRFFWRFFTGKEKNPPHERQTIPTSRAAYLFRNWERGQCMPPPLSVQLGIFFISTVAFMMLAGILWDWGFGPLILGVILFHEAGHWLAMRLLGYRNLQILMLPLVGGVTLGQESTGKAAHRALISLMGPLPGIILGFTILGLYGFERGWVTTLGLTLLLVNYLNLLPILPLDGGQLIKALIPVRRFGLLLIFEWLGAAGLLLLGWLLDIYFLSALALLPFLSGLALLKRKRVIEALEGAADDSAEPSPNARTTSIIHAIDQRDKRYRPLKKKARDILEILSMLRLKPAGPAVAGTFLALYIGLFVAPPVALVAAFPKLTDVVALYTTDREAEQQAAYDQAVAIPIPRLVRELADATRRLNRSLDPRLSGDVLQPPADDDTITAAEQRLAISIEGDYRQFLKTGNGFLELGTASRVTRYLLFPVQRVERFANTLSPAYVRIRQASRTPDKPLQVSLYGTSVDGKETVETFEPARLGHMLLIGNRYSGTYLLLEPGPDSEHPGRVLFISEEPGGFSGRYYNSLRDFLAAELSQLQD
jgi:Zn-dependent protease